MAGFVWRRRESADSTGEVRDYIITNSTTITLGDAVRMVSGYITLVAAGNRVWGVVVGLVDSNGLPLDAQHVTAHGGTYSGNSGVVGSETLLTADDNATDEKICARVLIDPHAEYYNDADDDLTAAMVGTYFDVVAASDQIDQATSGSTGQFALMEWNPDNDSDASKGIFRVVEHALSLG